MKKALITGIGGQDGSYLAHSLLSKGYQVFGSSRDAHGSFGNLVQLGIRDKVTLLSLSNSDFRSTLSAIQKVAPDEIYHLAGQSSVGLSFEQPVETFDSIAVATLNLLESVRFLGIKPRIYSAGSSECFGNTSADGANEKTTFAPRSPYGIAKATAFWQIANYREAYGLFACTGILFNHESPLRPSRFVTQKVVRGAYEISRGKLSGINMGNLDIDRDWGWAPDYVEAMWRMLQQNKAEDFVISTGEVTSLKDFVAKVFARFGLDWTKHVKVDKGLIRPSDISFSRGDSSYAREKLGWQASKKIDGIVDELVKWEIARKEGVKA